MELRSVDKINMQHEIYQQMAPQINAFASMVDSVATSFCDIAGVIDSSVHSMAESTANTYNRHIAGSTNIYGDHYFSYPTQAISMGDSYSTHSMATAQPVLGSDIVQQASINRAVYHSQMLYAGNASENISSHNMAAHSSEHNQVDSHLSNVSYNADVDTVPLSTSNTHTATSESKSNNISVTISDNHFYSGTSSSNLDEFAVVLVDRIANELQTAMDSGADGVYG